MLGISCVVINNYYLSLTMVIAEWMKMRHNFKMKKSTPKQTTPQAWQTVIEDYENRSGGDLTEALAAMYPGEVLLRNVVCPLACRGISYSPEDSMHTLSRKTSIMTNVSAAPAPPPGFVVDKDEFERFQEWRKGGGQNPNFRSHIGTVSTVSSSPSSSSSSSSSSSGTTNQPSLVPSNTGVVAISLINQSGQDTNKSPPGPPSFGRSRSPARRKNPSHPRTRVEQTHQPAHSTTSDVSPTGRSAKTNFVDAAREYVSSADRSEKERSVCPFFEFSNPFPTCYRHYTGWQHITMTPNCRFINSTFIKRHRNKNSP